MRTSGKNNKWIKAHSSPMKHGLLLACSAGCAWLQFSTYRSLDWAWIPDRTLNCMCSNLNTFNRQNTQSTEAEGQESYLLWTLSARPTRSLGKSISATKGTIPHPRFCWAPDTLVIEVVINTVAKYSGPLSPFWTTVQFHAPSPFWLGGVWWSLLSKSE